jgi:hypothetical protein
VGDLAFFNRTVHFTEGIWLYAVFVKDRWTGLNSIPGAKQIHAMPEMDFIERGLAVE